MALVESAPSWCLPETPKPEYKNDGASAFWDVPVYAEKTEVRANRIDVRVVDCTAQQLHRCARGRIKRDIT